MIKVRNVVEAMETIAPPALAVPGDPAGLHAGCPEGRVRAVAVALDASLPAIAEAVRKKADLLIVHHPRFYRGLSGLAENDPCGRRAAAIARSGLAVYSAHTALDLAEGGTNDCLAKAAGILDPVVVMPVKRERLLKLAVFVPVAQVEKVRRAVCGAGAGAIGKYSDCTFRTRGVGTFRGDADTKPFIGRPHELEEADEFKLETVLGEFSAKRVIAAMLAAHPYEEAAYDLYPIENAAKNYGFGRAGELPRGERLADFAARMAVATRSRMTQFCGKPGSRVRRAAVWAGGGVEVKAVIASGAGTLVTGELGYHDLETLSDAGISAVTLGHGHSETLALPFLAGKLRKLLPSIGVFAAGSNMAAFRNADRRRNAS